MEEPVFPDASEAKFEARRSIYRGIVRIIERLPNRYIEIPSYQLILNTVLFSGIVINFIHADLFRIHLFREDNTFFETLRKIHGIFLPDVTRNIHITGGNKCQ